MQRRLARHLRAVVLAVSGALLMAMPANAALVPGPVGPLGLGGSGAQAERQIVGGTKIGIREAPWQVNVWSRSWSAGGGDCGGAILNPTQILTAAHCVEHAIVGSDPRHGGVAVWAGVSDADRPVFNDALQERTVVGARVHPYYDAPGPDEDAPTAGDIAVLTLDEPLNLDGVTARAIGLAPLSATGEPPVGLPITVTGFGVKKGGPYPVYDGELRRLGMTVVDPDECLNRENALGLCVKQPSATTCQGDSGSPATAVIDGVPVIVGVVSNGLNGCPKGEGATLVNIAVPENYRFIEGSKTPPRAPRLTEVGAFDGSPTLKVGETMTCAPGVFSDSPTVNVRVTAGDGHVVAQAVNAPVAVPLTAALIGQTLTCRAIATNAGGTSYSFKQEAASPVTTAGTLVCDPEQSRADFEWWATSRVKRGGKVRLEVHISNPSSGADNFSIALQKFSKGKAKYSYEGWSAIRNEKDVWASTWVRVPKKVSTGWYEFQIGAWTDTGGGPSTLKYCDVMSDESTFVLITK